MVDSEKKNIRKDVLCRRNSLREEEISAMSKEICARFIRLQAVRNSSAMMIFLSFGSEVKTDYIIEWAWQQKKKVCVPSCNPETRELLIFPMETFNDVEPGYFGIREPKRDLLEPFPKEGIDLVVVPAVAFDRRGYRVGYGGGYYDRFLLGMDVPKIGIAFSYQIIPAAPVGRYDLPVDGIITENEYIQTA